MDNSYLRKHNAMPKGFRRFFTVVAGASITWCALFLLESNHLDKLNYFSTEEFANQPSNIGWNEWKERTQNLRSESKNKTFSATFEEYNTASTSTTSYKENKWVTADEAMAVLTGHAKKDSNHQETESVQITKSVSHNQVKPKFPRTVTLDVTFGDSSIPKPSPLEYLDEPEKNPILDVYTPRTSEGDIDKLDFYLTNQGTEDFQTHCVDMLEWQSKSYPVCNSMHELGFHGGSASAISELKYIHSGNFRAAYYIPNHFATSDPLDPDTVVLKVLQIDEDRYIPFDPRHFEMHRVDALISQKLTGSPYILDVYGFCGMSTIYEKGVSDMQKDAKYRDHKDPNHKPHPYPLPDATKALYASHIAKALLDLHGVDYPENPSNTTIVHADIKPNNIILVRRPWGLVAKLGDFNNSLLRKWNTTSNSPCPLYMNPVPAYWGGGYMPPEQSAGKAIDGSVDVFAFGAFLFHLLTGLEPRLQYPRDKVVELIESGQPPPLPPPLEYGNATYKGSNDEAIKDKTYHQSSPNDGDAKVVNAFLAGIARHMKVRPEDRPPVELANAMFESYNDHCSELNNCPPEA